MSSCVSLIKRVTLNSPVPVVIARLKVGDVLKVVWIPTATTSGRIEAQTTTGPDAGATAGSITFDGVQQLSRCLQDGHRYQAIVLSQPTGGRCDVEVRIA